MNLNPNFTPKYTAEQKQMITDFLVQGNKPKEIAETVEVPYHVVNDVKKKLIKKGILPDTITPRPRAEPVARLVRPGDPTPARKFEPVEALAQSDAIRTIERQRTMIAELDGVIADQKTEIAHLKSLLTRYMK